MTTERQDPTFQPGTAVFGYVVPGQRPFGNARTYPQKAIFGARTFGGQVCGLDIEEEMLSFIDGPPVPREKGPWPATSEMSARLRMTRMKRVILYVHKGRQIVRRYTPYDGSAKEHLTPWMLRFTDAGHIWSTLSPEAKARLTADAKSTRQACRGNNYFTKLYVKDDPRWQSYI